MIIVSNIDVKKTANTKLRNLIQPILVKKSYRYLGIPPRIKTRSAINRINFKAMLSAASGTYFKNIFGIIRFIKNSKYSLT